MTSSRDLGDLLDIPSGFPYLVAHADFPTITPGG